MPVLESYVISEAEIESVEEFNDHHVKSDGGVITLVALCGGLEFFGDTSVDEVAEVVAQVTGTVTYGRSDAATATMIGTPSGTDGKGLTDAATVTLVGVPSSGAADTLFHGYTDAATVSLVGVPSGPDAHTLPESEAIVRMFSVISAVEFRTLPLEAATVTLIGVPSGPDLKAHWFVDTDTITLTGVVSGLDAKQTQDVSTITVTGTVSAVETKQSVDAATITEVQAISGTDLKAHWFVDAATITLTGTASGVDTHQNVDAATVTLTSVPSGTDFMAHWYEDTDTATLVAVPSGVDSLGKEDAATVTMTGTPSGPDVYTPAIQGEIYMAALFTASNKTYTGVAGGGGASWTDTDVDSNSNARVRAWDDLNTPGHSFSDLPVITVQLSDGPLADHGHIVMLAAGGDPATPTLDRKAHNSGNGDNPQIQINYFTPNDGALLLFFVAIDNGGVAASVPPGHTLLLSGTIGTNSWYVYSRYPSTGDGHAGASQDDRVSFRVNTTGTNIHWVVIQYAFSNPGTDAYILDDGVATDSGTNETFTAASHG